MMIEIGRGCAYKDYIGVAHIMTTADGYAMMRRPRSEPFVISLKALESGWERVPKKDKK